jgi:hypothetical protein
VSDLAIHIGAQVALGGVLMGLHPRGVEND